MTSKETVQTRHFSHALDTTCLSSLAPAERRRRKSSLCGIMGVLLCAILLFPDRAPAREIKLVWEKNPEPNIIEYQVHYGNQSRSYTEKISAGMQTSYTFSIVEPGAYYFAVTALNDLGQESEYSNEVFTTVSVNSACDVNGDGILNAGDVNFLIDVILEKETCPTGCDITGDAKTNIQDLQLLGNIVLGRDPCP